MLQVEIYNKKKSNGQASDKFKRKKKPITIQNVMCLNVFSHLHLC